MRWRFGLAIFAVIIIVCGLRVTQVNAASPNVVISQVQLGTSLSASNEFIELYNNASTDTDITNWCLYYASSTSAQNGSKLACFTPDDINKYVYLPSHGFAFAISNQLAVSNPMLGSDLLFAATLSGSAGHIRIIDSKANVIDKLGWGTAVSPEVHPIATVLPGNVFKRKIEDTNTLKDTDDNSLDFEQVMPRTNYAYGAVYELQDLCYNIDGVQSIVPDDYSIDVDSICTSPSIDICLNIDGLQAGIPSGYELDADWLCQADVCRNISGLQLIVPPEKKVDADGNCLNHDYCSNLAGIQLTVPGGYIADTQEACWLDLLPLKINELLPNAFGADSDNEFIELYNPNDEVVSLSSYQLKIGIGLPKLYLFPKGSIIEPYGYIVFSNADIAFTLLNSSSQVSLTSNDNQLIDVSPAYVDPPDGLAWASIEGIWEYTNQPTPGLHNIASAVEPDDIVEVDTLPRSCAPNQFRSSDTNRCRLLAVAGSILTPCKDGQYRSETTNRCRSVAEDAGTVTLCNSNQYRNPDTNRCRLVESASAAMPAPCKEGQERNLDTNRCRNVAGTIPNAGFAVEPIPDSSGSTIGWLAVGGVCLIALGYCAWEWREECIYGIRKFGSFFHWHK
jgi:hypothetical protein